MTLTTIDHIARELTIVRSELQDLKRCQLHYFTLTVAGTAVIYGITSTVADILSPHMALLAPLAIVIPCWWIFFDKATTITRDVGYTHILEMQLSGSTPTSKYKFIGLERSLAEYRRCENANELPRVDGKWQTRIAPLFRTIFLQTRHRYWMVNWYTYFVLSGICCALSIANGAGNSGKVPGYAASGLTIISALVTLKTVGSLVVGSSSYNAVAKKWRYVLDRNRPMSVNG